MKQYAPKKVNPLRLERFVSSVFQKVGVSPDDADLTAKILVDADLRGIDSHGVMNLYGTYIKGIADGTIIC
jgi:LDH2 family malate/lactate/ureidoglycolate dehydrogenase